MEHTDRETMLQSQLDDLTSRHELLRVTLRDTQAMLDGMRADNKALRQRVEDLEQELESTRAERDIRGELLNEIKAAVGAGWWHGILDELNKVRAALIDTIQAQLANEPPSMFGQLMVSDLIERQIVRCRNCRAEIHDHNGTWRDANWHTFCGVRDARHEP